ncbi:V-set and immunoglobulin domain-containing protein 4 isoform X2 [Thamnophis elegans]|uniref:V-set and immunoglobulin domain-containing protein 4 isoform X2 n=1 Tax=Thamnophis elegans TaxID=35005 RepID=UPI0013789A23|nr:V-set and immunoglobulin domain-containing protein 4 isoform X2 [Thamnophis elegans]
MERWVQLWILSLVAVVPGKAVLHLNGSHSVDGIWRAPATLPCLYQSSSDFKQLTVTWKFSVQGQTPRTILLHDASGDHIFLTAFRDRVNVAGNPPGDVSLHIKALEMTDKGSFVCIVELEDQNRNTIRGEKTIQLQVVKVAASKPVVEASSQESFLPEGSRMSLTCSASGSPPITYQWYKDVPEGEAEELQRGPVLAFEHLQLSDSARYFCTAENKINAQKEQSDSFQLTVEESSEVSTAEPTGHTTGLTVPGSPPGSSHVTQETGTPVWNFVAGTSRRPEMTRTRTGRMVTSSTPFGNFSGHQQKTPGAQKKGLPLYIIILIALLSAAFILIVVSVVFCRRKTKTDNIYEVTYNNNALTLEGNENIPASPGVNGNCLYEEPNSSFSNNYTMEPGKADEYVTMDGKMDNEYEILVTGKKLGN